MNLKLSSTTTRTGCWWKVTSSEKKNIVGEGATKRLVACVLDIIYGNIWRDFSSSWLWKMWYLYGIKILVHNSLSLSLSLFFSLFICNKFIDFVSFHPLLLSSSPRVVWWFSLADARLFRVLRFRAGLSHPPAARGKSLFLSFSLGYICIYNVKQHISVLSLCYWYYY